MSVQKYNQEGIQKKTKRVQTNVMTLCIKGPLIHSWLI
jgi:hypothetical protein